MLKIATSCLMLLVATLVLVKASPVARNNEVDEEKVAAKDYVYAMNYLTHYRYLILQDPRMGRLRKMGELTKAVKEFQRHLGMKISGKITRETVEMMRKPRCGQPDFGPSDHMRRRKRYTLDMGKWHKNQLTYRRSNSPSNTELSEVKIDEIIRQSFDVWSRVAPLTFQAISEGTPDIEIRFEEGMHEGDFEPFDGPGGTLAHTISPQSTRTALDGDIHFDDDESWVLEYKTETAHLFWVAVHEIGHAIGLGHSDNLESIMFYLPTGREVKLSQDDITGIQMLYGERKAAVTTSVPSTMPTPAEERDLSACYTAMDAVFYDKDDGNTYFFKETQFWMLDKHNRVSSPLNVHDKWPALGSRVQAVYKRQDGMTVFFKGRRFWVYNGTKLVEERKHIGEYGLPLSMKGIDAVFVSSSNGRTYFFKGDQYWRYSELHKSLDLGYPKNITSRWGNIQQPVGAAMSWKDGKDYFFKGLTFQKYDFQNRESNLPIEEVGSSFLGCELTVAARSEAGRSSIIPSLFAMLLTLALGIF